MRCSWPRAPLRPTGRICIPRALVENAIKSAPPLIPMYDRSGALTMELGEFNSYFGSGSDLMSTWDLETGEHRPSTLTDVGNAARLCDALPNIDSSSRGRTPNEISDPHRAYLESFRVMVKSTTKPLCITAECAEDVRVMWEIACKIRGGAEELRFKPYFIVYSEPSSPLSHSDTALDKLLLCADWGVPCIYSPAPVFGATAPITHAGHAAQGTAESLFGLVIHGSAGRGHRLSSVWVRLCSISRRRSTRIPLPSTSRRMHALWECQSGSISPTSATRA